SRARNFTYPRIMIPSGGTSGKLKFCVHSPDTLAASVQSLFRFHHEKPLSSINPLPVFHVSGWMPIMRACLTGGTVRLATWKDLEQGDYPRTVGNHCSLSLVPTQLARLVRTEAGLRFLHGFDSIYIGGAAPSPVLVNTIRTEKLPALFVYGSTETASMVIAGTRADSDSSGSLWGSPLPGVEAELSDEQELIVRSPSLFRGYFPEDSPVEAWPTGDIARRLSDGNLQVIGRKDYLINTGGEKVNPEEVEAALSDCLPGSDFAVGSESDLEWGQRVVALVGRNLSPEEMKSLFEKLSEKLAPYKIPKRILPVEHIPRTLSGKINRAEVRHLLSSPGS
ncbi:MAG: AMP-binding protein, partial [Verrucomicrobiae bacterium]|nr:AMP-binding protein [Verrucomicrobiae bacterium]